ncbi:hypothetical protein KY328_01740 [Candidatus Woesearchaeota archaeon]|nr:hypothetical protein [Candidatus Woesearchaeota archaeon]MBW3021619.1 hypothetical protein [Candidatus Woesearchaeota archaeon]
MKGFSDKEIETIKSICEQHGKPISVQVGDYKFEYYVVPQHLEKKLKDFVMRATNKGPDYVLAISDSVPEPHRPYAVAHEFVEFKVLDNETEDRCVKALEIELSLVPEDIKPEYMKRRRDFFFSLIDYFKSNPNDYTPEDVEQVEKNYKRLDQLVKDLE